MRCVHIDYQVIPVVEFDDDEGDEFTLVLTKSCVDCNKVIGRVSLSESDDRWDDVLLVLQD